MSVPDDSTLLESARKTLGPERDLRTLTLGEFEELLAHAKTTEEQDRLIDLLCKVVG